MTVDRGSAWELVCEWTQSDSLRRHMLAVETGMRAYAPRFGGDPELWGVTGLVHDLDYERYPDLATGHPRMALAELERRGYPPELIRAVASHADFMGVPRESDLEKTLYAVDELSGFILAVAYVRPEGLTGMTPKSVKKKLKDRSFAAAVDREELREGAEALGVDFDEHLATMIEALGARADELLPATRPGEATDDPGATPLQIVVLDGDETGQELLEQSLRVLDPALLGLALELERFDLSLEHRRATGNQVVHDAARAMREAGYGLKAATITPETAGDVGSPNRILREEVDGTVIVRTGRRLPGVAPMAGVHYPISVVRMAVGDAYGAEERREGEAGSESEVAFRVERISRSVCRAVAEFAFRAATAGGARVYGGPKWTVSPVYEGMLKEELDAAAERFPDVDYRPVLIDATYAGLLSGATDAPLVIPALNRDGDCLSDLVLPMFGSIAGAESLLIGFDPAGEPSVVMAEAPHGTAPALFGRDVANPLAMILAAAALLGQAAARHGEAAGRASRAIYEAALEAVAAGIRTTDLGGHAGTTEFTDATIERVRTKLEVWSSLGPA